MDESLLIREMRRSQLIFQRVDRVWGPDNIPAGSMPDRQRYLLTVASVHFLTFENDRSNG